MEDQVIGGIDSMMQRPADDFLEDEADLRASDQDTISLSPSISPSTMPMMKLGTESEVIFKGSQIEGEERAREYIVANLHFSVLKEEMEALGPNDPGYPRLKEEIEASKKFLKASLNIPLVQEFIQLVKQKN